MYPETVRLIGLALVCWVGGAGCGFKPVANTGDDTQPMIDAAAGSIDARSLDAPCADDDHDGICNADDTWPCGAEPASPPTTVSMMSNGTKTDIELTAIKIDGMAQRVVAAPGSTLHVVLSYAITDTACAECRDQIEIGFAPGNRTGCVFDAGVPNPGGATGTVDDSTMTMPMTAGSYDLRANIGQNFSCTYMGATNWWAGAPDNTRTLAKVCVH